MAEPKWLRRDAVEALHDMAIATFGGLPGLRDAGLLESALARPRQLRAYESADPFRLAAAYAGGMVRNHPFADGNKRIGFMAAGVFLHLNGWSLDAPETEAAIMMRGLAAGEIPEDAFAGWLRDNSKEADA